MSTHVYLSTSPRKNRLRSVPFSRTISARSLNCASLISNAPPSPHNNYFVSRPEVQEQRSHFQSVRAGRRQQRLLNANRTFQKTVALRGEGAVTGKLWRRDRCPDVIKFIAGGERTIER